MAEMIAQASVLDTCTTKMPLLRPGQCVDTPTEAMSEQDLDGTY